MIKCNQGKLAFVLNLKANYKQYIAVVASLLSTSLGSSLVTSWPDFICNDLCEGSIWMICNIWCLHQAIHNQWLLWRQGIQAALFPVIAYCGVNASSKMALWIESNQGHNCNCKNHVTWQKMARWQNVVHLCLWPYAVSESGGVNFPNGAIFFLKGDHK